MVGAPLPFIGNERRLKMTRNLMFRANTLDGESSSMNWADCWGVVWDARVRGDADAHVDHYWVRVGS